MPKTPDGLPALMPERALNYDRLFTQDISDPMDRIKRVENAVTDLRHDFESVLPSIIRLVAVEKDIQQLTEQLGTLLPNEPQNAVMPPNASVTAPEGVVSPAVPLGTGSPDLPAIQETAQAEQLSVPPMPSTPAEQLPKTAPPATTPPPVAPPQAQALAPPATLPAETPQAVETVAPVAVSPPPAPPPTPPPQAPPLKLQAQATPAVNGPNTVMTLPAESVQPAAPSVPVATPAPASSSGTNVQKMRFGAQPGGKTRLVLDLSGWASYHFDIDNEEHLLIIELPKTGWNGEPGKAIAGNPLVASYEVQKTDDGGTRLIVTLRKNAKTTYDALLSPQGASGFRVVLDLQASP